MKTDGHPLPPDCDSPARPGARLDHPDLSNPEVQALAQSCPDSELRLFDDGDYLTREGENQSEIFLVVRGAFVVEQASSARSNTPATALATVLVDPQEPAFVGEMAYLGGTARTASVRCSGRTVALQLKPSHLDIVIEHFPALTRSLCRQFVERIKSMNDARQRIERLMAMKTRMLVKSEGELLAQRGEPARVLYQLVDGELLEKETGATHTADSLPTGFVEPLNYLRNEPHASTWLVNAPSILVAIDESSRLAVIRNHPELLLAAVSRAPQAAKQDEQ